MERHNTSRDYYLSREYEEPKRSLEFENRPAWHKHAQCQDMDNKIFFLEGGGDVWPAKVTCAGCTVRMKCLKFALEQDLDPDGIWGGTTKSERLQLRESGLQVSEMLEKVTIPERPYSFEDLRPQILELAAKGYSDKMICDTINKGINYLYIAKKNNPDFAEELVALRRQAA